MQNGLCGFLLDLQLRLFGVALMGATAVSAFGILLIPSVYISRYVKQQEILTTGKASPDWRKTPLTSWNQVLIIGLAPAAIALAIYFILDRIDQKDQQREIIKIDMIRAPAIVSDDVKFVQLTGQIQLDYQYSLKNETQGGSSSVRTNTYIPLTSPDWSPKKPIRYFIDTTFMGYDDPKSNLPAFFPDHGIVTTTFDGKLSRDALPTFVKNEFQRKGLVVESPYFVLQRMSFDNGRVPSSAQKEKYYLIPYLGIGVSVVLLIALSASLLVNKKRGIGGIV